jgi:hypothetical protein
VPIEVVYGQWRCILAFSFSRPICLIARDGLHDFLTHAAHIGEAADMREMKVQDEEQEEGHDYENAKYKRSLFKL